MEKKQKEYMRMAMLKHEQTFKEQVYELHRLYQIQKILMKNIDKKKSNGHSQERIWRIKNNIIEDHNLDGDNKVLDENEIELTLGPTSNYNPRRNYNTLISDSATSVSSSSTGSTHINRTSFLTHQTKNTTSNGFDQLGVVKVPHMSSGYQSAIKTGIEIEEGLKKQQPPWFCQVLRLKHELIRGAKNNFY